MPISDLLNKTLISLIRRSTNGYDRLIFKTTCGKKYLMYHDQDCCESVSIEDINGELDDLIGSPILVAEESTNKDNGKEGYDSFTWTFYRLATMKGYVVIRWYGESNGYYSESADFQEI